MPFSPSLAIVCLPSSDSHSLCLFRCKCHPRKEERRRAHNFGVLDSIQKVYFSLSVSPPFFLFYFFSFFQPPFKQGARNSGRRTAILPVCVYLCGIDLTSKPPREKKRFVSFYRRRNTQREKEKERKKRVEMVESVTRANRITLYFPPDEGWWLWYGGEDLRRRWGG